MATTYLLAPLEPVCSSVHSNHESHATALPCWALQVSRLRCDTFFLVSCTRTKFFSRQVFLLLLLILLLMSFYCHNLSFMVVGSSLGMVHLSKLLLTSGDKKFLIKFYVYKTYILYINLKIDKPISILTAHVVWWLR